MNQPLFGVNVDPGAGDPQEPFRRAAAAEKGGLDLLTIQDHPYNVNFLETWTLLSAIASRTERIHLGTNVLSTPLRPPAMLAKMALTLQELSGGRLELGLGAGAYPAGIAAMGGFTGESSKQQYQAFKESLEIVQGMFSNVGGSFTYQGDYYQVKGARIGPAPEQRIPIWLGAIGPSMLRLTGQKADGLLITNTYVPVDRLPRYNRIIDEGAAEAGRKPQDIRRGYNLQGVIDLGRSDTRLENPRDEHIFGSVEHWCNEIVRLYRDYRQDTITFWPVAGNELVQIEAFAAEVVPAAREAIRQLKD
jgi:alkanesulfonate monooxygenase SsuD/methylene tetrahydromethanopterin reductase-like flavin-dependent oxidoreductase (luciferase family)